MKAIILAAGKGTRLRPLTNNYQKTMVPVHGKPLIEYIIDGLIYAGFNEIIIVVGYQKEQIKEYFKDGKNWDIEISYVEQKTLNGTGGALLLCEDLIEETHFFLTWGDILVPYWVYEKVFKLYKNQNEDFILVANYQKDLHQGCAVYEKNNYCIKLIEKPPRGTSSSHYNNCGVFLLSKELFEVLENVKPSKRGEIELPIALSKGMNEKGWRIRILKLDQGVFRGDFGNLKNYHKLNKDSEWLKEILS